MVSLPFYHLIGPLHAALDRPTIYVLGENGARADELCKGSWLANFTKMLSVYAAVKLVCISAGGNDFAGVGDLDDKILAEDCGSATTVDQCFRAGQPDAAFADVASAYKTLLDTVSGIRPSLTVLVHNYDYAIPNGRMLPGMRSWLKLPMDNRRVPTAGAPRGGLRREIVRALIDHQTLVVDALEAAYPGGTRAKAELVWSAGTLADTDWANDG